MLQYALRTAYSCCSCSSLACPAQKRLVLIDQDGSGPGGSDQMAMLALLAGPAGRSAGHHHGHRRRLARRGDAAHPAHAGADRPRRCPGGARRGLSAHPHPAGDASGRGARRQGRHGWAHGEHNRSIGRRRRAGQPPAAWALRDSAHARRPAHHSSPSTKTPRTFSSARCARIRTRSPSMPPAR